MSDRRRGVVGAVAPLARKRCSSPAMAMLRDMAEYQGPIPVTKAVSSVPHERLSARSPAWMEVQSTVVRAFRDGGPVVDLGRAVGLVRSLRRSLPPQTILDYMESKLLRKGFKILLRRVEANDDGEASLVEGDRAARMERLEAAWRFFHRRLVHELQCLLQPLGFDFGVVERSLMLGFRDGVLLPVNLIGVLREEAQPGRLSPTLTQMLLVLQMYREAEPPSDNDVTLEKMVALVVRPYIGYLGVYNGSEEPELRASLPDAVRARRQPRTRAFISRKSLFRDPDEGRVSVVSPLIVVSGELADNVDDDDGADADAGNDIDGFGALSSQRPRLASEPRALSAGDIFFV